MVFMDSRKTLLPTLFAVLQKPHVGMLEATFLAC